jgi:hypothetical protein
MMNTTGGGALGCGHPQKPGTRFCTVCGQPAVAAGGNGPGDSPFAGSAHGDGAYRATQTVTIPGRAPLPAPGWPNPPPDGSAPAGYPGTPGPQVPPGGPRRSRWLLAAGIAASLLLVGGAGGGAYLLAAHGKAPAPVVTAPSGQVANAASAGTRSAGTGSAGTGSAGTAPAPAPTPPPVTGQQAAARLAGLLAQSVSSRSAIVSASLDAGNCGGAYARDAQTFRQAAAERRNLIQQLDDLPGAQTLPGQMLSDLRSAWQASATADDDYAGWADDEAARGCTTNDSWYAATSTPNQQATAGKMAFIATWNPLASRYGLPTYDQGQL